MRARSIRHSLRGAEGEPLRPDLVALGRGTLRPTEIAQLRVIRRSFEPGRVDAALRWCQRTSARGGSTSARATSATSTARERLPALDPTKSYICVCNHRSFFDLYVVTTVLVLDGMPHRMLFPVRSNFFYDHPLGFFVNGVMSFFAMYPPVFRERQRARSTSPGSTRSCGSLRRGGAFVGVHPEGTRKKDSDPYALLPAQSGIGRIIRHAKVHGDPRLRQRPRAERPEEAGLGQRDQDGRRRSLSSSASRSTSAASSTRRRRPRLYKQIADRSVEAIAALGEEERRIRSNLQNVSRASS